MKGEGGFRHRYSRRRPPPRGVAPRPPRLAMGARCAGVQPLRPACSASRSVSRIRIVGSDCGTRGAGGDAASWGDAARRLHGRFWVLRERGDGAGTDLVSDAEDGPCAVGLGMTSSIASLLTRQGQVAAAPPAAGPQAAG